MNYKNLSLIVLILSICSCSRSAEVYFEKGVKMTDEKRYNEAIECFTDAIEVNPNLVKAYFSRGFVFYNLNKMNEALSDYNKAIELDPEYASAYNNKGNIKEECADYQGALSDYSKAIECDSMFVLGYTNRARIKVIVENHKGAISDYSKAIDILTVIKKYDTEGYYSYYDEEYFSSIYFHRGVVYQKIGKTELACADSQKADEMGYTKAKEMINKY